MSFRRVLRSIVENRRGFAERPFGVSKHTGVHGKSLRRPEVSEVYGRALRSCDVSSKSVDDHRRDLS